MKRHFCVLLFLLNIFTNNCFANDNKIDLIVECVKKFSDKLGDTFSSIAGIAGVVTIAKFGKDIAVEVKERVSPGHDRQLSKATQEMHKCLFEFKAESKDQFNLPVRCAKHLDNYERLAGRVALNRVRDSYKE